MINTGYSVIIPVYNSAAMIEELCERLINVFENLTAGVEIIFVDDHSTDNSWTILKKLKKKNSDSVKIIRLAKNSGQHLAILCGLAHATNELIITMDDDLQHPPEEIPKLIDCMHTAPQDLIYGIGESHQSYSRAFSVKLLKWLSKNMLGKYENWCSFRLMKKNLCLQICKHPGKFFNLDQAAYQQTDKIGFVEVNLAKRQKGKSGYTGLKLASALGTILLSLPAFSASKSEVSISVKEKYL